VNKAVSTLDKALTLYISTHMYGSI